MRIRLAEEHDAEAIAQIVVRSWQSAYIGIVPQEYLDRMSVAATKEHVMKLPTDGFRVYIAEINDAPVGFITVGESRDDDATADTAEVEGLYLSPEHSRKGIGSALWKQACEDAVEKGAVTLAAWLFEENETARSFYESMGCFDSGTRKTKMLGGREISVMRVSQSLAL